MPDSSTAALLASLPPPLPPPAIDPRSLDIFSLKVIARLRRHGHAAYLVGGCVRDLLVGAHPKDFDVATSAHPEQIRDIFRNCRLIGRRFRLAHVLFPGNNFVEVATFRSSPVPDADPDGDGDLLVTDDNQFGTAEEDARRRDFTINGLFYDVVEGRVIDYVGGREDLRLGRVRTIGDPEIRFREDPVRGLRAARIAAKLNFTIEEQTFAAMVRHAGELPRCAPARVLDETLKLLRSGASSRAFRILRQANLLAYLLPPVDEVLVRGGPAAEESFLRRLAVLDALILSGAEVSEAVVLATLLSFLPMAQAPGRSPESESAEDEESDDLASALPSAEKVLARMSAEARLGRKTADRVRLIIVAQRLLIAPPRKRRRRGGGIIRTPHFADAMQLLEIGVQASGENADALARWKAKAEAEAEAEANAPPPAPEPVAAPVDGTDAPEAPPVTSVAPEAGAAPAPGTAAKKRRRRGGRGRKKATVDAS
jgi:poly(A) polymerase